MKLHEKIKKIRLERGLSLKELRRMMYNDFKQNTVTYRTLQRIEAGDTDSRGATLHQISTALGMTLSELKKDTEEETKPVDLIKRNKRLGRYVFNEKVFADLLIRQKHTFMVSELVLKPQGKTRLERDPDWSLETDKLKEALKNINVEPQIVENFSVLKFEKYIYCLRGNITCYIGNERYVLNRGDGLIFSSSMPHWFENNAKSVSHCLIFQNPRHL